MGLLKIHFDGLLRIVSVSGLIGFLTNWIAITMLFRPRSPRPILRQGLIPAQKMIIAEKLADSVTRNLINAEQIHRKMVDSGILSDIIHFIEVKLGDLAENTAFKEDLYNAIRSILDDTLHDRDVRLTLVTRIMEHLDQAFPAKSLERLAFRTYRNLREDQLRIIVENILVTLPDTLYQNRHEFDDLIASVPSRLSRNRAEIELYLLRIVTAVLHKIDLREIILENINNYDEGRLEQLIQESTMDQLNYIKYLGAVLGMLGGLFIWNPIAAFLILTPIIGIIVLTDAIVFRFQKNT